MQFIQTERDYNKRAKKNNYRRKHSLVYKLRRYASQYCAAVAFYFSLIGYGTQSSFVSTLIVELGSKNLTISATREDLVWISIINYLTMPIGGIASGILGEYLSSRIMLMIVSVTMIFSWLMLFYASSLSVIYIALVLIGVTAGLLQSPIITYVSEISEPRLRGILSSGSIAAISFGLLLQTITHEFVGRGLGIIIYVSFPIVCFVMMFLVPDSPYWLARKGEFDEAKTALAWLRGWSTAANVSSEFHALCKDVRYPSNLMTNINNENEDNILQRRLQKLIRLYFQRSIYIPFFIGSFACFICGFNGSAAIQIFVIEIFKNIHSPMKECTALIISRLTVTIGSIITMFIIPFSGRRKILLFSTFYVGLSLLALSIYLIFFDQEKRTLSNVSLIPTIIIFSILFVSSLGITPIVWTFIGELFPTNVRSITSGILGTMFHIFLMINHKSHPYMVDTLSFVGIFLLYALINFLGSIVLYFVIPETEGRSLKEIEEHFTKIHDLKNLNGKISSKSKLTIRSVRNLQ